MTEQAPALFVALEQSGFASAIRQSIWLYPTANIGHIVFLVIFAGAVAMMDVRLLGGLAATDPARLIGRARSVALLAFVGMVVTGFILFSAEASHVVLNPAFLFKMSLIAVGLLNIAIFEFGAKYAIEGLKPNAPMPASAKVAGVVSAGLWVTIAACGRSIAYF